MSVSKLKEKVKQRIDTIQDLEILEAINNIIELEENNEIIELTNEQKVSIEAGIKDIRTGNTLTHEEANKEIVEWLKK